MPTPRYPTTPPRPWLVALLLCALLLPIFAAAPPTGADDPCQVTVPSDSGAGSLRQILADPACATITFQPGLAQVNLTSYIEINRTVTIQGPGRDLLAVRYAPDAASYTGSVIYISAGTVAINDLTIADGKTLSLSGAGLGVRGTAGPPTVTLSRVRITNNVADGNGGGIYASNAGITLIDSEVTYNTSSNSTYFDGQGGGGIHLDDYFGSVTATLLHTTVAYNSAVMGNGGGIGIFTRVMDSRVTMLVFNSTIASNNARYGGGIANRSDKVTLSNTTISANFAKYAGGGIWADDSSRTDLIATTVTGNIANGIDGYTANGGGIAGTSFTYGSVLGSIIAGNADLGANASSLDSDCGGTMIDQHFSSTGTNLFGTSGQCPQISTDRSLTTLGLTVAAALDPTLADNGGPTQTHALVPGGPAIDLVPTADCAVSTDQRGAPRPQGAGCDAGAYEADAPVPSAFPSPSPSPLPSPSTSPAPSPSPSSSPIPLPSPSPLPNFGDVPLDDPALIAIGELAARGIINGCDPTATPPLYCPDDTTLRHQMAALIVRAMPGWQDETWPNSFTDPTEDAELWRRVGTLQHYGVVIGYTAESCVAQGKTPPCYGPLDPVLKAQAISFVTRAMVKRGYWTDQPIDHTLYGGALVGTGHEQDASTYWYYTWSEGGVPDYPLGSSFPLGEAAPRDWFARLLWTALQGSLAAP